MTNEGLDEYLERLKEFSLNRELSLNKEVIMKAARPTFAFRTEPGVYPTNTIEVQDDHPKALRVTFNPDDGFTFYLPVGYNITKVEHEQLNKMVELGQSECSLNEVAEFTARQDDRPTCKWFSASQDATDEYNLVASDAYTFHNLPAKNSACSEPSRIAGNQHMLVACRFAGNQHDCDVYVEQAWEPVQMVKGKNTSGDPVVLTLAASRHGLGKRVIRLESSVAEPQMLEKLSEFNDAVEQLTEAETVEITQEETPKESFLASILVG